MMNEYSTRAVDKLKQRKCKLNQRKMNRVTEIYLLSIYKFYINYNDEYRANDMFYTNETLTLNLKDVVD